MRTAITTMALAGLATATAAQNIGTATVTASAQTVSVGDTLTLGVLFSDNITGNSVFAFDARVTGVGAAFSVVPGSVNAHPDVLGFKSEIFANSMVASGRSFDILGPTFDGPLDDLTNFTFQVIVTQAGSITFSPEDGVSLGP